MNRSLIRYLYFFQMLQQFILFIIFGSVVGTRISIVRNQADADFGRNSAVITNFIQLWRTGQYDQMLPSLLGKNRSREALQIGAMLSAHSVLHYRNHEALSSRDYQFINILVSMARDAERFCILRVSLR